jgi:hypothetical protein
MPVRAATRVFPQKGSSLPEAATPKGKLHMKFRYDKDYTFFFLNIDDIVFLNLH